MRRLLCILPLALAASLASAAGTVEVSFKPVADLTDPGRDRWDGERNVKALGEHFQALARRLPDGQALKVEVTDLDLAGRMKPTRHGSEVRVLDGRADWPSLTLRWTLAAGGRTLATGDERVTDMAYLMHGPASHRDEPLGHERRLIERWFDERVLAAAAR
ncbi:MAG: DUF3016 domain-containing protein [Rubrivivax sp.]